MQLNEEKFRKVHGYEEGTADAIDAASAAIAYDYKKHFLKQFITINQRQIDTRLGGERYYVTRKYDGEYAIIFYENGQAVTVNRSGRVRRGLPCIEEAAKLLKKAKVKQAVIPAEIYAGDGVKKAHVHALVSALADAKKARKLRLAAFDILEWNGKPWKPNDYEATAEKLHAVFDGGEQVHAADMEVAPTVEQVKDIYRRWVEEEGSEGLVVRSGMPFVFKIKPRHSLDLAVIGFSEGTGVERGRVRSLLTAFMPEEGRYQVIGRVGSGLDKALSEKLFKQLSKKLIPSEFIETDANAVAFQMVKPELVVEITVNDMIYEAVNGPKLNALLKIEDGGYRLDANIEGMSFIAPVFVRVRTDKGVNPDDVRPSQVEDFSYYNPEEAETLLAPAELPPSELLLREVYRKEQKNKLMIQKYLIWKTNKEKSGQYPAYVLHITNFSTDRAEPLQRDVRISDTKKQILELYRKALESNIKQGWQKI